MVARLFFIPGHVLEFVMILFSNLQALLLTVVHGSYEAMHIRIHERSTRLLQECDTGDELSHMKLKSSPKGEVAQPERSEGRDGGG
jgi:hypothetical protein